MLILPFEPSIPEYRFATQIEQVTYRFRVRWNSRTEAWYFDVLDENNEPIALGLRIALGAYLGRYVSHELFRGGRIYAVDTTNQGREAGFDDLGVRVEVRWVDIHEEAAELVAAALDA